MPISAGSRVSEGPLTRREGNALLVPIAQLIAGELAGALFPSGAFQTAPASVTQGGTLAVAGSTLVDALAEGLQDEVDLGQIQSDILATVESATRPEHGAVWIRGDGA